VQNESLQAHLERLSATLLETKQQLIGLEKEYKRVGLVL